jgi:hypothetical protein
MFHALSLYVATGITSFGWALSKLAGWDARPWLPLWFCAALLVYNVDRLQKESADSLNVPRRTALSARLRGLNLTLIATASVVLLCLPAVRGDWRTLALVIAGAIVCLNYSRPLLGFRFKDVPLLKTFFAPTIVVTALIGLPLVHEGAPKHGGYFAMVTAHAWALLLFNMALCDLRDLIGDRRGGIVSLPLALGGEANSSVSLGAARSHGSPCAQRARLGTRGTGADVGDHEFRRSVLSWKPFAGTPVAALRRIL